MLLKNKAPSKKSDVEITKLPNRSPKPQKKMKSLEKSNKTKKYLQEALLIKTDNKIDNIDIDVVCGKDIFLCNEVCEEIKDSEKANQKQMKKNDFNYLNKSSLNRTSNRLNSAKTHKQESPIDKFSDIFSTPKHLVSLNNDKANDSMLPPLVPEIKKQLNKRKLDSIKNLSGESLKVQEQQSVFKESIKIEKVDNTIKHDEINNSRVDPQLSLGSVVWAKAPGFPWWPAIVDDDPDINACFWFDENTKNISDYHVSFLDDDVSRIWVLSKNIKKFDLDPEIISTNIRECKKGHRKLLEKAIDTAKQCLNLEPQLRLNKYSFIVRFTGKSNIWSRGTIKRTNKKNRLSNICESLDLEATLIEAASDLLVSSNKKVKSLKVDDDDDEDEDERRKKIKEISV